MIYIYLLILDISFNNIYLMFKVSENKWTFLYESIKKKKNSFHTQNNHFNDNLSSL